MHPSLAAPPSPGFPPGLKGGAWLARDACRQCRSGIRWAAGAKQRPSYRLSLRACLRGLASPVGRHCLQVSVRRQLCATAIFIPRRPRGGLRFGATRATRALPPRLACVIGICHLYLLLCHHRLSPLGAPASALSVQGLLLGSLLLVRLGFVNKVTPAQPSACLGTAMVACANARRAANIVVVASDPLWLHVCCICCE